MVWSGFIHDGRRHSQIMPVLINTLERTRALFLSWNSGTSINRNHHHLLFFDCGNHGLFKKFYQLSRGLL